MKQVIPIKPMIKHVQTLLDHRDKIVREETKQLVVEMYHWVREAIRPQLANLKPVQLQVNSDQGQVMADMCASLE